MGNLSNFRVLYLHRNQLSGPIPLELGNLSNLQELYLLSNQLCGNIPLSLLNLSNLKFLYLRSNGLNITNLDPALKAFFDSLEQISWEPQNPSICPASLATLAFFEAQPNLTGVLLQWQTLVETDHDIVLIGFETSKGNGFSDTTYFYQDNTINPATTYCYLPEDRDFKAYSTFYWDSIVSVTTP